MDAELRSVFVVREGAPAALVGYLPLFLANVRRVDLPPAWTGVDTHCYQWTLKLERGYGYVHCRGFRSTRVGAHVASALLFVADVPLGDRLHQVHHRCHRTWCVRPSHLQIKPRRSHIGDHNRNDHGRQETKEIQKTKFRLYKRKNRRRPRRSPFIRTKRTTRDGTPQIAVCRDRTTRTNPFAWSAQRGSARAPRTSSRA